MKKEVYYATKGSCLHAASIEPLLGTKLGFFLARSPFLPAHASL